MTKEEIEVKLREVNANSLIGGKSSYSLMAEWVFNRFQKEGTIIGSDDKVDKELLLVCLESVIKADRSTKTFSNRPYLTTENDAIVDWIMRDFDHKSTRKEEKGAVASDALRESLKKFSEVMKKISDERPDIGPSFPSGGMQAIDRVMKKEGERTVHLINGDKVIVSQGFANALHKGLKDIVDSGASKEAIGASYVSEKDSIPASCGGFNDNVTKLIILSQVNFID